MAKGNRHGASNGFGHVAVVAQHGNYARAPN